MTRRVVITGMGTVNPLSSDVQEYWKFLLAGKSGIAPIEQFDTTAFKVRFGGEVKHFAPEALIDSKVARRLDRFSQFAMIAAIHAVNDCGLDFKKEDPYRSGVIIGSGIGGLNEFEEQHTRHLKDGPGRISPFVIPKMIANAAAGNVSIHFGLSGPNTAVSTACASAANAISDAFRAIQWDYADVMVTGGSEAGITPMGLGGFCSARALSSRNDAPQLASRPFDKDRDGFVLSEGAGIIVLEELERAKKRGAKIYCEVLGAGSTADAHHITAPHPCGAGAAQAMVMALRDAKLNPEDVQYVNAHGTSTELGDEAETKAVKQVFGEHAKKLAISSTKSMIGHLLGASGGVELIATALTIKHGVIHPTINYQTPDPGCDLDYVPNTARETRVKRAISNSFGFGGHNCCLVIGALS
ncbi:MAG: beta-ketoacyl-ACP synthase II [Gemmataceae bacterium]|nr:beta-ketoacyl-ACP synthase II [Gemmataceae bacterium]